MIIIIIITALITEQQQQQQQQPPHASAAPVERRSSERRSQAAPVVGPIRSPGAERAECESAARLPALAARRQHNLGVVHCAARKRRFIGGACKRP